jgi:hypothetical protein
MSITCTSGSKEVKMKVWLSGQMWIKRLLTLFQVECHPYLNQSKMIAFCKEKGIVVGAYAPFGRPGSRVDYIRHDVPSLLEDAKLREIASKRGQTVAQIILRYLVSNSNNIALCACSKQSNVGTGFLRILPSIFLDRTPQLCFVFTRSQVWISSRRPNILIQAFCDFIQYLLAIYMIT